MNLSRSILQHLEGNLGSTWTQVALVALGWAIYAIFRKQYHRSVAFRRQGYALAFEQLGGLLNSRYAKVRELLAISESIPPSDLNTELLSMVFSAAREAVVGRENVLLTLAGRRATKQLADAEIALASRMQDLITVLEDQPPSVPASRAIRKWREILSEETELMDRLELLNDKINDYNKVARTFTGWLFSLPFPRPPIAFPLKLARFVLNPALAESTGTPNTGSGENSASASS